MRPGSIYEITFAGEASDTLRAAFDDCKVITGLLTQESKQLVALKAQGGEVFIIPRGDIEELRTSKVSLMPEGLERQLAPQEIADLFAFLCLDRPPDDPKARKIPGTPR